MKVLEQTPTRLSLLASANDVKIFGVVIFVVGVLIAGGIPTRVTQSLTCNRNEGRCEISRSGQLGGPRNTSFPVDELQGSTVETDVSIDKKGHEHIRYNVMLLTKSYDGLFFVSKVDKEDSVDLASQINDFAHKQDQPSLSLSQVFDFSIIKNVIFFITFLIGIIALMQDDVTYTFDNKARLLFIKRQGLRGGQISSESINHLLHVTVDQSATRNRQTGKTHYLYKLNLLLSSGKIVTLTSSTQRNECDNLAYSIKRILNMQ